ncbi:type II toxin-antitoxin system RelE/ParE family toxin [Achromobacter animicus]|uniref:type II toxin-antitoxin system RelE/ParE family toxin n=1 Tax=Achromobacter animicus TaxID=1389935 RepID=UPI0028ABE63F|nr:type II toxin-antitoxin system RelE/ParE family toxin [Achromobacter animicus]
MYEIEHYLAANGRTNPYLDWLKGLRDNQIKVAVIRRISRIELGNFGDHRFCRDGVWELRIDAGPGYRVYFAPYGKRVVLLLCGGDKKTQASDIDRAVNYRKDWEKQS